MANPRKFSEKIALHTQKQAEETAAFEKIMREVSDATSKGNPLPKQHLRINQNLGSFRGGSLPNVNNIPPTSSVDLKSALSNLEEMKAGRGDVHITYRAHHDRGRRMDVGGPMRSRPGEKRIDTSPYSGAYLSPPTNDPAWRRTSSDSALHTSAQAQDSLHSPGSQRRVLDSHGQLADGYDPSRRHLLVSPDGRPRSCCDVPRVPGINIYPSAQEPGTIQIPIGNNTGSLPDLTSCNFTSPLPTPLDQEDHNSSPYSNSPQGTSPSTLSPTSRPQGGRFSFGGSPPANESPPSPLMVSAAANHLSVPSLKSRFLHNNCTGGVTIDNSREQFSPHMGAYHQQRGPSPHQSPCSPLAQTSPLVPVVDYVNSLNYRSQPVQRPSPQNSPGLTVKYEYGSTSPLSSSPQSPSSPPASGPLSGPFPDHNNYFISQQLQQHFEQFSMDWCQLVHTLVESNPSWTAHLQVDNPGTLDFGSTNNTSPYSHTDDSCPQELTPDPGYFSTSPSQQLQYSRHSAPNTPSSIPDLVVTDFSSTTDDLTSPSEDLTKELGCAMAGGFDPELFPSDDCLREGLSPLDFASLQMLTDPDPQIITDPNAEEQFRFDRIQ